MPTTPPSLANFLVPCTDTLSCYISPQQFSPITGQYSPLSIAGIGPDLNLLGYIDGISTRIVQGTRRFQVPNRRFRNCVPTTLGFTVSIKEILRRGNQTQYGADQTLGGSMLVAAASASPYLVFQLSSGPYLQQNGLNQTVISNPSQGTTWVFWMVWNNLDVPYDSEGPQVITLDGEALDPGFNGSTMGPQAPVLYQTQGQTSPLY